MKKLTALIIALLLAFSAAALAEETASAVVGPDPYVPERSGYFSPNRGPEKIEQTDRRGIEYEARYKEGKLDTVEVELENKKTGEEFEVVYNSKGEIISAEYESSNREIHFDGKVWKDAAGKVTTGPNLAFMKKYYNSYYPYGQWYYGNTMGLVGISLRDQYPGLTDKWYNVVPIDLTKEGSWSYPMAVSNKYYMGNCIVTVREGKVTVDYTIPYGKFYVQDQCLAWFTDVKDIDANFLNNPKSTHRFGQPVSIADDLKGQKVALLFICNHIDYHVPLQRSAARPSRLLRGNPDLRKVVAGYVELLDSME